MRRPLLFCLCLALCTAAFADKILLKDGREYEGVIVEETETTVKIKTARATVSFPKSQIESIDRAAGGGKLAEREKKLEALDGATASAYLAAAEWLTGPGREVLDLQILRRLCHAAASLDRKVAAAAMILLGRELAAAGIRPEAGSAFMRALNAEPGNTTAKRVLEELKRDIEGVAKKEMTDLRFALDLVVQGKYEDAAPRLRKCGTAFFADASQTYVEVSFDSFATDIQKRIQCRPCNGTGRINCVACGGDGIIGCNVCDGTGKKKGFVTGKNPVSNFSDAVCRSCFGLASGLCTNCKSERDVQITFTAQNMGTPRPHVAVTVHTVAGKEKEGLKTAIDLVKYTSIDAGSTPVESIIALGTTAGGKSNCGTCGGVKYEPPDWPVNAAGVGSWIAAIDDRLGGRVPFEVVGAVDGVFDAALLADGLKYKSGKWTR